LDSDLVRSVVATLVGSLDEFTKTISRENEPGHYNRYASIETQVLGMVLRGATNHSYQDYFDDKIWSKLGAEYDAHLLVDAVGEPVVYGGVSLSLRDMLRFGKIYLDGGVNYSGERLVPAQWIQDSIVPDGDHVQPGVDNPRSDSGFGYGYQWWLPLNPKGDYAAIGIYGQFIYINPVLDVVIVKTSAYPRYTIDGGMMNHESLVAFQQIAEFMALARHGSSKVDESEPLEGSEAE
jgi:CubicO group peptidase (beta-lactamase class C family)